MSDSFSDFNFSLARKSQALQLRAKLIQSIRAYFINNDFLEVETPLRIPSPAPEEHIEALPSRNWFLQTSPELCMKRMLAAGYSRIFQISHCFRAGERGDKHLPEFTMLEWYVSGFDYHRLMNQCEELICSVARDLSMPEINRKNKTINLSPPWERLSVADAFLRYAPLSMEQATADNRFDEILVDYIEPRLGMKTPTFIYDYPAKFAALAKLKDDNHSVGERFELYIGGVEIANGFSELTDANEQRRRFTHALKRRAETNMLLYEMPETFLNALETLSPCAGIALGIDRLVMIMASVEMIDEVVAFSPENL